MKFTIFTEKFSGSFHVFVCYLCIRERLETVSSSLAASLNSDGPLNRDGDNRANRAKHSSLIHSAS